MDVIEPTASEFFTTAVGVCVYVNVGGRAVRVQFQSPDARGAVEGNDEDASAAVAVEAANRAFDKCKSELRPLFKRVAVELEERRGAHDVQFLPTGCESCQRVALLAAEQCTRGQSLCPICGGRVRVVPGGTYAEGDVAVFRELSEIVARGNVRAAEAQRLGIDIERACAVGAETEAFLNIACRLAALEPMRVSLEHSRYRQRQTLMMLATILHATAPSRRSGTIVVVEAPAVSRVLSTGKQSRR